MNFHEVDTFWWRGGKGFVGEGDCFKNDKKDSVIILDAKEHSSCSNVYRWNRDLQMK
jgi:hypothetical protein